jgi:hypothetical protein
LDLCGVASPIRRFAHSRPGSWILAPGSLLITDYFPHRPALRHQVKHAFLRELLIG